MIKKILIAVLALFSVLASVMAIGYFFRESLLRIGANAFLSGQEISLTQLAGVQVGAGKARIAEIELLFHSAGLRLDFADIELTFSLAEGFRAPVLDGLVIASARLVREGAVEQNSDAAEPGGLLLSDLLLLLRDFPLASIAIEDIELPQWHETLALHLQQQVDELSLRIDSETLQLAAVFNQPDQNATAQLQVTLAVADTTVGEVVLSVQPPAAGLSMQALATGYQLTGTGRLDIADAKAQVGELLSTTLPLSAAMLDWDLAARVADDFLASLPAQLDLGILAGSTLTAPVGLVPGLGEFTVVFSDRATLGVAPGTDAGISIGSLPLSLSGSWQEQAFGATLALTAEACQLSGSLACSIGFDASATLAAYTLPGAAVPAADIAMTITAPGFVGSGMVALDSNLLRLSLDPGASLTSAAITSQTLRLDGLNINNQAALTLNRALDGTDIQVVGEHLSGSFAGLSTVGSSADAYQANSAFSLRDIDIVSAAAVTGGLRVQTEGLQLSGPQPWLPALDVDASLVLDQAALAFDVALLFAAAPTDPGLRSQGSYELATGNTALSLTLPPLTFAGEGKSLSAYLGGDWPYSFDAMTGTLALELALQVRTPAAGATESDAAIVTANVNGALTEVAGYYGDIFFRGLNGALVATADTAAALPVSTPPLALTVAEINVGLPISNIVVNYQLDGATQTFNIASFYGELLDGTVSGEAVSYDFTRERNDVNLRFSGFRLDRMLELAEYDGVQAVGAVSGELPITITGTGVEVAAGRLYAEAPGGSIRYLNGAASGQGNPGLDLVNQALSNYQFESLESGIDYTQEGELLLAMQLQGHNPDMNNGQRINLNLNLSDNIPILLRSLRTGRVIEDFLEDKY